MNEQFHGKTVFITGTNRGIGKAMLQAFAERGANLTAHARKPSDEFEAYLASLAKDYSVEVTSVYFDMTDTDAMKSEVKGVLKKCIPDILVNNAAAQHGGLFLMTPLRKIKDVFEVNLFAHMSLTQHVLKPMTTRKTGCIINIASISGLDMKPGYCAYGASKAALIAWTKILATEVGRSGIRVNALAPGLTDTEGGALMEEKAKNTMLESSILKRLAKSEEIADVACYLASDFASFINGQVIRVDGGSA